MSFDPGPHPQAVAEPSPPGRGLDAGEAPRLRRALRVAVAGLGPVGLERAMALAAVPGCELAAFSDPRREARAVASGAGFQVPLWESAEALLKQATPDALFLCVPHDERASLARAALEARVALWCETPVAVRGAEAAGLIELAEGRGTPFFAGFTLPFDPVFARVRSAVADGVLGRITEARATVHVARVFQPQAALGYERARVAGGALAHQGLGVLHALVWMLGRPARVEAQVARMHGELEDELHARLELPGGAEAILEVSWSAPGYPRPAQVLELRGTNGGLLASDDAFELDLDEARGPWPAGHSRTAGVGLVTPARWDLDGDADWLAVASFLAWVSGGPAPPAPASATLDAHLAMDALYASAADAGAPVALPR